MTPRLALVLGDPAGIGPEIMARLLAEEANRNKAALLLVADPDELAEGMRIAGVDLPITRANDPTALAPGRIVLHELRRGAPIPRGQSSAAGGAHAMATLRQCLAFAQDGTVDGIVFAPLNKSSLHMAQMGHPDELHWFAEVLGHTGAHSEFNVLDGLWTCRVTSHVAIREVADLITPEKVIGAVALIRDALVAAGIEQPRIAVCGLNPHNGDNGAFGREEIEIIGPALEEARRRGLPCEGPYPADTIFLRAQPKADGTRDVDAIVTMYHDQGQIAMKLMGFWRGITVAGGLPVPIATCAHGTGFDIQGKGIARVGALQAAFDLACTMGARRRARG
jgi:4-hydroxythreonine-4-phosphate dehydrogenase